MMQMPHSAPYPGDLFVHLKSFLVLIGHLGGPGSFENAAQDLAIDRSVLRRRVATLTEWVGRPLLEGRGPRTKLSASGEQVATHARALLRGVAAMRETVATVRPNIVVGCTGTITTELLPNVIVASGTLRPAPRVTVRRVGGADCRGMLERGEIDLGISRFSEAKHADGAKLCEDRLFLLAPTRHPLARAARINIAKLRGTDLVLYGPRSRTRKRVMERLADQDVSVAVEVSGKAAVIEYVRRGLGIGFVSAVPWAAPRHRGIHVRDVTSLFPRATFVLQVAPARRDSEDVRAFARLVRAEAKARLAAR